MRIAVAASGAVSAVLSGPAQPARWLGVSPAALYLKVSGRPGVVTVLAHDGVRLPCGVLLPTTRDEMPLTDLLPPGPQPAGCVAGDGQLCWDGPAGPVVLTAVRSWAPARVAAGRVSPSAVAAVRSALPGPESAGLNAEMTAGLRALSLPALTRPDRIVAQLLGRGPGLTPAADDALAGLLAGANAFWPDVTALGQAVARLAPTATTALSAALLWHAARRECIDEVAALAAALTGRTGPESALQDLLAVGHTSGAALAWGFVLAAERALDACDDLALAGDPR
jgi:hypothetical protein